MASKYKIAFVLPYFGRMHSYFDLFLRSCEKNPDITWLLFTDDQTPFQFPSNVNVTYISFEDLKQSIQQHYDFPISLNTPYELVNYKPAYGELFQKHLSGYDFWGYCDCDLLFGDIRKFITDELLESYKKILMRGHFTLFKNSPEINFLYRREINGVERYKEVFSNTLVAHFDEGLYDIRGINTLFMDANIDIYDEYIYFDVCASQYAFIQADHVSDAAELSKSKNSCFIWDQGALYRYYQAETGEILKEEFMYIHLQKRVMRKSSTIIDASRILIIPNQFTKASDAFLNRIKHYNRHRIYYAFLLRRIQNKLKRIFS